MMLSSLSIDVDMVDCYYRAYGIPAVDRNEVYTYAIPRMMEIFDRKNVKGTFFIVGKDLVDHPQNRDLVRRLADAGHEIANHTYSHPFRFSGFSRRDKFREISESEKILEDCAGKKIVGFRCPGWDIDAELLDILEERGYLYDSSVFPSSLLIPLKIMHRLKNFSLQSTTGMGSPWFSTAPIHPYFPDSKLPWRQGNRQMLEIPIGVVPHVRLPFLGTFLFGTGWSLFQYSFNWIVRQQHAFTYALHPIELLGIHEDGLDPRIRRQPGMHLSLSRKFELYEKIIANFLNHYELVTMEQFALSLMKERIHERANPPTV